MTSVRRPKIPKDLELEVLYRNANACAICQKQTIQIHHIDKDRTNNVLENLILLCQEHHGEAHTKRELTLSLTAERIRSAKRRWESEVKSLRQKAVSMHHQQTAAGELLGLGVTWGYINHRRVASLLRQDLLAEVNQENLRRCIKRGLVDSNGYIIPQAHRSYPLSYTNGSIYDQFDHGDDHRVHRLYCDIVDSIALWSSASHVDDTSFKVSWINHFVTPGAFLFLNRGHYFEEIDKQKTNIIRRAYTQKRGIRFEYLVETKDMFGTSSMTVSFKGHRTVAALVLVKSIERSGMTTVHCTPIALGAGHWPIKVGPKIQ